MSKQKLNRDIEQLEKRLDYNYRLLGLRAAPGLKGRKRLGRSGLGIIGAALAGGIVLGALAPRLRGQAPKLLPLLLSLRNARPTLIPPGNPPYNDTMDSGRSDPW